jgi:hypothetical protein
VNWSEFGCSGHCVIPDGTCVTFDESADLESLRIFGRLIWAENLTGLELKAGAIFVDNCGLFQIGTIEKPMANEATIYIKNNLPNGPGFGPGKRFLASGKDKDPHGQAGQIEIHGVAKKNTWTLLTRTVREGQNTIDVEHDVSDWNIGDEIVVAYTSFYNQNSDKGRSQTRFIKSIDGQRITVDRPFEIAQLGRKDVRIQAEVMNMSRNIVITGDDFEADHGLHTRCNGYCRITYTKVEKCGQRGNLGKYCLHFHHAHDCPACLFQGNAVINSKQRGVVIHGTHRSRVRSNVLHHVLGAGIYVEDGNEMQNAIVANVNVCAQRRYMRHGQWIGGCRQPGTDNNISDDVHQSGMWSLSPTNDYIGNRMVGHQNGFFLTTSAFAHGKGASAGKVCTRHSPLGIFRGNVNHSGERFGFYLDAQWPRRVKRSIASNGHVEDMAECLAGRPCSCDPYLPDGTDNGAYGAVEDHLDFFNIFVGQYELGDVQYRRQFSVNNHHGMYWKQTKNFHEKPTHAHIIDSTFMWAYDDELRDIGGVAYEGLVAIAGPGGVGAFRIENTKFVGRFQQAIAANQHCGQCTDHGVGNCRSNGTGALCTPEYNLVNVKFDNPGNGKKIRFGFSEGRPQLPIFTSPDNSLGGMKSMANEAQQHLLHLPECSKSDDDKYHDPIQCSIGVRRLQVWAKDQGTLNLRGPNGGFHHMTYMYGAYGASGYGADVAVGKEYTIELPDPRRAVLEFSDPMFAGETLILNIKHMHTGQTVRCVANSNHSRKNLAFVAQNGAFDGQGRGNAGVCLDELKQFN